MAPYDDPAAATCAQWHTSGARGVIEARSSTSEDHRSSEGANRSTTYRSYLATSGAHNNHYFRALALTLVSEQRGESLLQDLVFFIGLGRPILQEGARRKSVFRLPENSFLGRSRRQEGVRKTYPHHCIPCPFPLLLVYDMLPISFILAWGGEMVLPPQPAMAARGGGVSTSPVASTSFALFFFLPRPFVDLPSSRLRSYSP